MNAEFLHAAQEAILLTVLVSAPPIVAALLLGLLVAVFQALTQIQEQTVQVVTKLVAVFGALLLFGYWMAAQIYRFGLTVFQNFQGWVG